ncbi:Sigma-54 interaction domain-containing protein [Nannocystis exedens]|uniref:Sigma-54 interaction domain-containing protein n=1 Tax=Nannocystis exedens TaxID=54 RepID=A0A1I2HC91_9BACT|nr:sigma 54-interacting transcriptional regulator [Nannocystis exedens]PCC67859.1 Nif-specific regulatory protein [Nannocystis exedens]SFF27875.1 Sigma-54 interaction domain-containing protein [Nannocystis exedens]
MEITETFEASVQLRRSGDALGTRLGLVILWSADEPERVGEVALAPDDRPGATYLLGRAEASGDDPAPRLEWARQRPGLVTLTGPLRSPRLSRTQLAVELGQGVLHLDNRGRSPLLLGGREVQRATLAPDDVVVLARVAVFMCVRRPAAIAPADPPLPLHPFGDADADGIVGEDPLTWALRARVAFVAGRNAHVLVRGPSGTGKELVAQAVHRHSARGRRALVARNAATFPETLIDAELFGNARNFPNTGTPERPGLVGEADGGTLFLDEFAELPQPLQAHLLRVLDGGEYSRLGEAAARRADFRLIAATNRSEQALKDDVLARLPLRLELAGLGERRADIPLIARHILRRLARADPLLARRFFPDGDPARPPRVSWRLIEQLASHRFTTHVRELESLLWRAMTASTGDTVDVADPADEPHVFADMSHEPRPAGGRSPDRSDSLADTAPPAPAPPGLDPLTIPPDVIQRCLDRHEGRQEPVWRELGLSSRHVLTRLVRRYNLQVRGRGGA